MNENDVITALECCLNGSRTKSQVEICSPCPYFHESNCTDVLKRNALELIRCQKAEIEMLQKENSEGFAKWQILDERTKERYAELYEEAKGVVRAEAIKDFAERLKAVASHLQIGGEYNYQIITINSIDYLVKEMTEAQHDGT